MSQTDAWIDEISSRRFIVSTASNSASFLFSVNQFLKEGSFHNNNNNNNNNIYLFSVTFSCKYIKSRDNKFSKIL
jgi:hypothetical protein